MIERTHAQRHWLKMAASRAVDIADADSAMRPRTADDLITAALRSIPSINVIKARTNRSHADRLEEAAAFLLRAAVVLRRERSGS